MRRGDIYRLADALAERGDKPGFYVVVSRDEAAENQRLSTVICAPIYSQILGLSTEVVVTPQEGVRHTSAVRCDLLSSIFKSRLTHLMGRVPAARMFELDAALAEALGLPI